MQETIPDYDAMLMGELKALPEHGFSLVKSVIRNYEDIQDSQRFRAWLVMLLDKEIKRRIAPRFVKPEEPQAEFLEERLDIENYDGGEVAGALGVVYHLKRCANANKFIEGFVNELWFKVFSMVLVLLRRSSQLHDIKYVAQTFGVHPLTIRRWFEAGKFPKPQKYNGKLRWRGADIDAWIEQHAHDNTGLMAKRESMLAAANDATDNDGTEGASLD